jgi:hypothetical protein
MYQADKSALGAIVFFFVMTPFFFMNDISFLILSKNRFSKSQWQRTSSSPNSRDLHLDRYLNQFRLLLELKTF